MALKQLHLPLQCCTLYIRSATTLLMYTRRSSQGCCLQSKGTLTMMPTLYISQHFSVAQGDMHISVSTQTITRPCTAIPQSTVGSGKMSHYYTAIDTIHTAHVPGKAPILLRSTNAHATTRKYRPNTTQTCPLGSEMCNTAR